jgi:hypothetical protein
MTIARCVEGFCGYISKIVVPEDIVAQYGDQLAAIDTFTDYNNKDPALRDRMKKVLFYTASNISSIVQYGGIGALEGSQACIEAFRTELLARRDLFYDGIKQHAGQVLSGTPPRGAFYASSPRGGRRAPRQAIRCRGRWRRNSSHAAESGACPGPILARTERATSASASRGIGGSSPARSSR